MNIADIVNAVNIVRTADIADVVPRFPGFRVGSLRPGIPAFDHNRLLHNRALPINIATAAMARRNAVGIEAAMIKLKKAKRFNEFFLIEAGNANSGFYAWPAQKIRGACRRP